MSKYTLLNAVTSTSTSQAVEFKHFKDRVGFQVIATGSPTVSTGVNISLDGTNYDNNFVTHASVGANDVFYVVDAIAGFVTVTSTISGGTSPTVTVKMID